MGKHFKCLQRNDDSVCSSSSDFFAKSNKTADCEAKKDAWVFNDVKFVMDSVLRRVEDNSKYEAAKKQAAKKRHSYTALFKVDVINMLKDGFLQVEVAEYFHILPSQGA